MQKTFGVNLELMQAEGHMIRLETLTSDFVSGSVSRRRFMEGALALGMTIAGASAFVAKVRAAIPRKGGVFRLGVGGASTVDVLDPATYISTFTQMGLANTVYNNLTEMGSDGRLVPELAESFEATPDARQWTFRLRESVEFHNGKTLDAEDVIASINHHRDEASKSSMKPLLAAVEELRADGPHTVIVRLKEGNADFPYLMNDYHLPIGAAKNGKIDWQSGNGTGGYALHGFDPGVKIEFKRNTNYWKQGKAHFDEAVMLGISDATARQNALINGTIDAMNRVDLKTANLLEREPGVVLSEVTGTQQYTMPMNTTVAPFKDNNVRLALKCAVDREAMVKSILRGHGRIANDHPIAPANRYFAGDLEQRVYDPDKVKFYLRKAGLDELSVDLSTSETAFPGAVDAAVLYAENAGKAGITINVIREADDGYWTNVWKKKAWVMSNAGGRPTEDWIFTVGYSTNAIWNESYWSNDRFMQLLLAARSELDEGKRRAIYRDMQQIVRDQGGTVVPMYANWVDAHSTKVAHNKVVGSNWELDGWKAIERWWFA